MSLVARFSNGETLELVAYDGRLFRFVSARAFAPGQPLRLSVALGWDAELDLKSLGSVRRADGTFEVRARAATLAKGVREGVLSHFGVSTPQ